MKEWIPWNDESQGIPSSRLVGPSSDLHVEGFVRPLRVSFEVHHQTSGKASCLRHIPYSSHLPCFPSFNVIFCTKLSKTDLWLNFAICCLPPSSVFHMHASTLRDWCSNRCVFWSAVWRRNPDPPCLMPRAILGLAQPFWPRFEGSHYRIVFCKDVRLLVGCSHVEASPWASAYEDPQIWRSLYCGDSWSRIFASRIKAWGIGHWVIGQ